jgi:hypothetical protein
VTPSSKKTKKERKKERKRKKGGKGNRKLSQENLLLNFDFELPMRCCLHLEKAGGA